MSRLDLYLPDSQIPDSGTNFHAGGLFLDPTVPSSFIDFISFRSNSVRSGPILRAEFVGRPKRRLSRCGFLSVSLVEEGSSNSNKARNAEKRSEEIENCSNGSEDNVIREVKGRKFRVRKGGRAVNASKHLWAGAVAAMVSRTLVAPLERLKLEYIIRGEKKHLFELVQTIAVNQGLRGFWKGNLLNILRTAPFKAVNFCAFDTYRKQLLGLSGNKETTNFERLIAGAAAGITATTLCLPLDTIRTKLVAHGGEALGGVVGAFRHMIQTEGFFSLYKGLVPSIISMAPSSAVFYGVYDVLKSSYLHSPEGQERIRNMSLHGQELNALDQLELGPIRTLIHGAISGACAEVATYPFEVLRRRLQMQVQATKLNAFQTCVQIVEQGGIPAFYAGLIPSLLQVLPSAAIGYFVYEFMKVVLKAD